MQTPYQPHKLEHTVTMVRLVADAVSVMQATVTVVAIGMSVLVVAMMAAAVVIVMTGDSGKGGGDDSNSSCRGKDSGGNSGDCGGQVW